MTNQISFQFSPKVKWLADVVVVITLGMFSFVKKGFTCVAVCSVLNDFFGLILANFTTAPKTDDLLASPFSYIVTRMGRVFRFYVELCVVSHMEKK